MDDKAQLQTLEGLGAALLITMTVVIITQSATVITPQHEMMLDVQLEQMAYDILTLLDVAPSYVMGANLTECVAGWDLNQAAIKHNSLPYLDRELSVLLPGLLYNVDISYVRNDSLVTKNAILNGYPTEDAVVARRTVMLTNSTVTKAKGVWPIASDELQMVEVRLTVWQV
ncbi:hypothetical protein [uncultured Methanomethylovorans sp.]|uniref:DUF7288 family protein n=1 Tax=uncultured Methanomethylovorans sp. TaxID=183759 RepID=UPI002AA75406|nr:hypothetical protein [uncultured Methanomethylovorans sp.]